MFPCLRRSVPCSVFPEGGSDLLLMSVGALWTHLGASRHGASQRSAVCITICCMRTLTIRTDAEVEQALESLTRDGQSRSEATRAAILEAERAHRRARLRAEAEQLRNDPDDVAASRELAAEMDNIRAW